MKFQLYNLANDEIMDIYDIIYEKNEHYFGESRIVKFLVHTMGKWELINSKEFRPVWDSDLVD